MDFFTTIVILLLTTIVCLPLFKNYKRKKALAKVIDVLPGDKRYPIIGTALKGIISSRETRWAALRYRHPKYGPMFRSWLGSIPVVHIYKPQHAEVLLKYNNNLNKGGFYQFLLPWLGGGLISGNLPNWRHHRKVITPAFHFKVLESYMETFADKAEFFAKYLDKFAGKGHIEINEYLNRHSLDTLSEAAIGVQLNFLKNEKCEYGDAVMTFLRAAINRTYNPLLHYNFIFGLTKAARDGKKALAYIRKYNAEIINRRKEHLMKNKDRFQEEDEFGRKKRMSFLDILLTQQENNNFSYEELEEEVNTFMFAGHDTTAATNAWALMYLGNNPDILKKVQEELDEIFEDNPNRRVTTQDLAKMEYLDRVLKETLRCSSFVPLLGRELSEDVEIGGVIIPKKTSVLISLYDLHHDPTYYPDPWKFDPDRFLPENVQTRHPFAFIPFSAGARNCIGQKFAMQNSKTTLAYILRKFDVTSLEKPEDIQCYYEILLRSQTGNHIAFEHRKKN